MRVFCAYFRYVSLEMMRTIGRHFGVVKLVPLRVSSRLSIDNLYIISGLSGKGSDYVVLKD